MRNTVTLRMIALAVLTLAPAIASATIYAHPWHAKSAAAHGVPTINAKGAHDPDGGGESGLLGFGGPLGSKGEQSAALSGAWQQRGKPLRGPGGAVVYIYGDGEPEVVCAVFYVCDIELQRGEDVTGISIGDSARWLVTLARPADTHLAQHVLVKPTDVGLSTDLIITTTRRVYHIHLVSDRHRYNTLTRFVYPQELLARQLAAARLAVERKKQLDRRETIAPAGGGLPVMIADRLHFDYRISGHADFRPIRVYNDGVHTIIQEPRSVLTEKAPVLLAVSESRGSAKDAGVLNYRMVNNRFIVDGLPHKMILVSGVGWRAHKVIITMDHNVQ